MIISDSQINAEKTVIGHLMSNPVLIESAVDDGMGVDHFVLPGNRELWLAIRDLSSTGKMTDAVSVQKWLEARGKLDAVGGVYGVAEVLSWNPVGSAFTSSMSLLFDLSKKRKLEVFASEIGSLSGDLSLSAEDVLAEAERRLPALRGVCGVDDSISVSEVLDDVVDQLEWRCLHPGEVRGLKSGFPRLDRTLDGLQPEAMIVIAARPGVGKTAILVNVLMNLALSDDAVPVGVFSMEMSRTQLIERIIYGMSQIDSAEMRRGQRLTKLQMDLFRKAKAKLSQAPIHIDDRSALTIEQIQAKARRMVREHGVRCIGVDYIQLARSSNPQAKTSREREVAEISSGLKSIAKELKIPVIVLAQLNRDSEKRSGKSKGVPEIADLRESGSIEQDSDQILLIHRPHIYDKEADPREAKMKVAKNRFGELGFINLEWDAALTTFTEAKPKCWAQS